MSLFLAILTYIHKLVQTIFYIIFLIVRLIAIKIFNRCPALISIMLYDLQISSLTCEKTYSQIHTVLQDTLQFCTSVIITIDNINPKSNLLNNLLFSILLHIHISQASNLLLSVRVNVHVSAAYSAMLQTKQFIILFFSSRFILPINNFFGSINTFLPSQFCFEYLLCNIHPLILICLNIWIGSLVPLVVHQHKSLVYYNFPFRLCTSPSSF